MLRMQVAFDRNAVRGESSLGDVGCAIVACILGVVPGFAMMQHGAVGKCIVLPCRMCRRMLRFAVSLHAWRSRG